jgi:DNA-binding MarR family transcriptional regulator
MRVEREIDASPLLPIQCACTNLKKAARIVGRAYDQALAPTGVNGTQYAILINVHRNQPISQMRLASHLGLERTTLYRAVDILERKGLLRATATGEGVTQALTLTPRGERITRYAQRQWEQVQRQFEAVIDVDRWRAFLATLETIRQHFGNAADEIPPAPGRGRPRAVQRGRPA